ncbi:hypothetical protein ACW9UR_19125 [Halovulum sp. GXIMD14794]
MQQSFPDRLKRALAQLALAALNATLILIVLGLFFAWRLAVTAERITDQAITSAAAQVAQLSSVQEDLTGLKDQFAGLRADIEEVRLEGTESASEASERIAAKLDEIEAQISEVSGQLGPAVEAISIDPGILVDRAVETGMSEFGTWVAGMRGCDFPGTE